MKKASLTQNLNTHVNRITIVKCPIKTFLHWNPGITSMLFMFIDVFTTNLS